MDWSLIINWRLKIKILIACEYSGRVREAFAKLGHDAWSCDLLPTEQEGNHIIGDCIEIAYGVHWDLMVCHPPCTDLAVSGAKHFPAKISDGRQQKALDFVKELLNAPIQKIALENPVSIISSKIRLPSQYIQPWQFGHGETKKTGLWLKGLPLLKPTNIVEGREAIVHKMPPGPDRWKNRSRTYQGIADAMAIQWGSNAA